MATKQKTTSNKKNGTDASTKRWEFRAELMDELLAGYEEPSDLTGPDGMLQGLIGALVSRAMQAEMTEHLGYERGEKALDDETNRRNGRGRWCCSSIPARGDTIANPAKSLGAGQQVRSCGWMHS